MKRNAVAAAAELNGQAMRERLLGLCETAVTLHYGERAAALNSGAAARPI
jgi:hypothetical protein